MNESDEVVLDEEKPRLSFEVAEKAEPNPVELSVPDKFEADEKYSSPIVDEAMPRIRTTYVPRFTEVSQNYRMAGEKRQEPVKVSRSDAANESSGEKIDPTAEIYSETKSAGKVSVTAKKPEADDKDSASQVFKFLENEPMQEADFAPSPEPLPEEAFDEEPLEIPTIEENDEPASEPQRPVIPDPVFEPDTISAGAVAVYSVKSGALEDAPDDVGDRITDPGKTVEYTSYAQRDSVKDKFLDVIMSVRVRFFAAAAITLILLVLETMVAFGVNVLRLFKLETFPGSLALIDAQFILCLFLIALPETVTAFKYLLRGRVLPELYMTVSIAVIAAYTAIIAATSPKEYAVFGLLFAVPALASIGATYFKKSADFTAFKKISQNKEKKISDNRPSRTLEHENAALDGAVEEHKSRIMRLFRTVFVSDFFKRSERRTEKTPHVALLLFAPLGAALVTGAVVFFVPGGIVNAATAFVLVYMLAVPTVSLLVNKLPCFFAQREADGEDSAFIGEASLIEYSAIDVITFEDTEVFGEDDVTLQRIMLYGRSENLTKAMRQMSALFMNVGGPLDRLFSDALDRKTSAASNTYVEDGGICGEIDSRPALAGTLDYMLEKGIRVPEVELKKQETLSDSVKVMYAALDGEVYAKFYIRYSFSEEFSMLLPPLSDEGVKILVYTSDPNITGELIKSLTAGSDNIRIMRKYLSTPHANVVYREVSAGMVTFGEKTNAINMIFLAKRYSKIASLIETAELVAMTAGGVIAILLSVCGVLTLPSLVLAAWQAVWCGALHILSSRVFRASKK